MFICVLNLDDDAESNDDNIQQITSSQIVNHSKSTTNFVSFEIIIILQLWIDSKHIFVWMQYPMAWEIVNQQTSFLQCSL